MSRRLGPIAALVAMFVIVVGVPLLLLVLVGNPWPGSSRIALGDEAGVVVGVLAVLAWLVWARFVVAVAIEARNQVAELRRPSPAVTGRVQLVPPPARTGTGLLAQRLVAAVLVLLPLGPRGSTAHADGARPVATAAATVPAAAVAPPPAAPVSSAVDIVTVRDGDTLFGLARTHLGDSARWREIFDLNRDVPQPDGGRLASPSLIRTGWRLALPAAPVASAAPVTESTIVPPAPPAEVVVATGDTLWDLARSHLEAAGLDHGDVAVADYVHRVVAENGDVIEDPNLIYAGERLQLPAVELASSPVEVAPALPVETAPAAPPTAVVAPDGPAPPAPIPPAPSVAAVTTTTTSTPAAVPPTAPVGAATTRGSPSPIGIGEAALLSAGVLALVGARRRLRLRSSQPRARVPSPRRTPSPPSASSAPSTPANACSASTSPCVLLPRRWSTDRPASPS